MSINIRNEQDLRVLHRLSAVLGHVDSAVVSAEEWSSENVRRFGAARQPITAAFAAVEEACALLTAAVSKAYDEAEGRRGEGTLSA